MSFFKKTLALIAILMLTSFLQPAKAAGFLEQLGRAVIAPVVAPAQTTIQILRGDDPRRALQGPWQSAGQIVQQGSEVFRRAQDTFTTASRDVIRQNLGEDWVTAYNILTASQRVQYELAMTSGAILGKCMQGIQCSLQEITAAPLAAALRDAYKAYIGYAGPMDPNQIRILSHVIPMHVLQAAKITVGSTPNFTVPGMLNAANESRGNGHAVTIGNLIIFSRPLNFADLTEWNWLMHELAHIEQYMGYSNDPLESIDGFAVDYTYHYNAMESNAQGAADSRQMQLNQICQFSC